MIILFAVLPLNAKDLYFCTIKVKNPFPTERGFINSYLSSAIDSILLETGWVYNCKKGKPVEVKVVNLSFKGSAISGNRFSGYTFSITINLKVGGFNKSYTFTRFVALPNPSLGTLKIRSAFVDIFETGSLQIKKDLLKFENEKLKTNF